MNTTAASSNSKEIVKYKPPTDYIPKLIILISGKRKSGKDFLTSLLENKLKELGINFGTIRMANPIKYYWATKHGLDYKKMLDSGSYKEEHRLGMANWSVDYRKETIGYFPHESILMDEAIGKEIWICADMRHVQDMNWFYEFYPSIVKKVRVFANDEVRKKRGWIWTLGIDDGETETELDNIGAWDLIVENNDESSESLESGIQTLINWIQEVIS